MTTASAPIRVVLFDLGGVLVELSGVPALLGWMNNKLSPEELFAVWLSSPAVRAFERGRSTPEVFAEDLVKEIGLPITAQQFLNDFTGWPRGLLPGALELVQRVPASYIRATLSNTNMLHWSRLMHEMKLGNAFDHHFASHLTGRIKPDEEAFQQVVDELECEPSSIFFIDDNLLNVEAARRVGITAVQVKGVEGAEHALIEAGILISSRDTEPMPKAR